MIRKVSLIIFKIFVLSMHLAAQSNGVYFPIAKAPDAAAISKFIETPVDMSTGVPNITIPIYTLAQGNLSIPISLTYHAGGIKVNEIASSVGLGWALNTGGIITRSVRKEPDESGGGYYPNGWQNPRPLWCYTPTGCTPTTCPPCDLNIHSYDDTEPDIFSFSFDGYSGRFVFDKSGKAHLIPEQDLKVEWPNPATFVFTTPSGAKFIFGILDKTRTYGPHVTQDIVTSSWHLTQIVTSDQKEINFEYELQGFQSHLLEPENYNAHGCNDIIKNTELMMTTQDIQAIKKITTDICEIRFSYKTSSREDLKSPAAAFAIDNIQILDKIENTIVKRFNLSTSYFNCTGVGATINYHMTLPAYLSKRLRLDAITECDANGNCLPPYIFSYNKYNTVPNLPNRVAKGQDHWGFYNGQNENQTMITNPGFSSFSYLNSCTGLGNREVDPTYQKAFILDEILFPSGGITKYLYESCYSPSYNRYIGGIRIASILNSPGPGLLAVEKLYEYGLPYFTGGPPIYEQMILAPGELGGLFYCDGPYNPISNPNPCLQGGGTHFMAMSDPINFAAELGGHYVLYDLVKEKQTGNGWVENRFDINSLGNEIDYEYASQYPFVARYPLLLSGKLLSSRIMSESGSILRETNFTYGSYRRFAVKQGEALRVSYANCFNEVLPYCLYTGGVYLTQEQTIENGMLNTIDYEYAGIPVNVDPAFGGEISLFRTKISRIGSDGKAIVFHNRFPKQYDNYGFIQTLLQKNIIGEPIEEYVEKDGNIVSGKITTYRQGDGRADRIYHLETNIPISASAFTTSSMQSSGTLAMDPHFKPSILFNEYDMHGNLIEVQKAGDILKSYIWDYKGNYPVAEVLSTGLAEIAYTSFESEGMGGWNFTSQPITSSTSTPSGSKCFTLTGNSIYKSGFSNLPHVLSYWSNAGHFTVTGSVSVRTGLSYNGWTNFEHIISGVSSLQISGSGLIDELRFHPATASMITRVYKPLVGITNEIDANNRMRFYYYDGYNRLRLIRDMDNNIIRKICYNYTGQAENCNDPCTNFTANWQNTSTPPVCVQNYCGNSGYQQQEQRDMNPCSPTYNQTQTITIHNPSACTPATGQTVTYSNTSGQSGYTATYFNTRLGLSFSFPIPSSGSGILGCIPAGVSLTLTISKPPSGTPPLILFGSGCHYISGTWSASFNALTSCFDVSLDWDY